MKLYMFRGVPLPIIRSLFTVHCTHGTGICHTGLKTASEQDHPGPIFFKLA